MHAQKTEMQKKKEDRKIFSRIDTSLDNKVATFFKQLFRKFKAIFVSLNVKRNLGKQTNYS